MSEELPGGNQDKNPQNQAEQPEVKPKRERIFHVGDVIAIPELGLSIEVEDESDDPQLRLRITNAKGQVVRHVMGETPLAILTRRKPPSASEWASGKQYDEIRTGTMIKIKAGASISGEMISTDHVGEVLYVARDGYVVIDMMTGAEVHIKTGEFEEIRTPDGELMTADMMGQIHWPLEAEMKAKGSYTDEQTTGLRVEDIKKPKP